MSLGIVQDFVLYFRNDMSDILKINLIIKYLTLACSFFFILGDKIFQKLAVRSSKLRYVQVLCSI